MKDGWWNESAKNGKDTASLATPITPAANTTTEPPITGMLPQSDDCETVPANPAQWLYSVTKREPSREEFLIDSDKKGNGEGKKNAKAEYFAGYGLQCKGWGHDSSYAS